MADVVDAIRCGKIEIGALIEGLRPVLSTISWRLCRRRRDDLYQEGLVAVWQQVSNGSVDTSRPDTVKAFLIRCAANRMKDVLRKKYNDEKVFTDLERVPDRGVCWEFNDIEFTDSILQMYLSYIRLHGKFNGAHAWVAKQLKITTSAACTAFYRAVHVYKETHTSPFEADDISTSGNEDHADVDSSRRTSRLDIFLNND